MVVAPYAYLQIRLSPFQLGLVFASAGVGALVGATVSTAVGDLLGTGGAITCSYAVTNFGVVIMLASGLTPAAWASAVVLGVTPRTVGSGCGDHRATLRSARLR